jgi:outer membrane protein
VNRTFAAVLLALAAAPASAQETVPFTPPAAPSQAAPHAAPPGQAGPPRASAPARVLTLDEALRTGLAHQPQIQQAQAGVEAARGRVDQALAPMLPQVTGTASYERTSGTAGQAVNVFTGSTVNARDLYSLGLTGRLLVWDFGQTPNRWRAARAVEGGQEASARSTSLAVALSIRTTYFNAVAYKALVGVARDRLANEERHYQQIKAFVEVGTRPQIDLVSEQANLANARVQLIQAENNYATARVLVEQATGAPDLGPWEVADQTLAPIPGEEAAPEVLLQEALAARPDLSALSQQIRAQELTVSALQGGYLPSLGVSASVSEQGPRATDLTEAWNTQVTLSWPLFQGGLTRGQVREAKANATALDAQRETARQQVRVDVEQARLGVRAAAATLAAAKDASASARQQLALAEGRYQTGVGSVLELSDAQLALTTALGQQVQAEFTLASARSQLLRALGRQ